MPLYAYQVLDKRGGTLNGKLEAENEYSAATRLRKLGYTPVEIIETKTSAFSQAFQFKKKVGIADLSIFSRQLTSMLSAGIPLTRCLFALGEQAVNPALGKVLLEVGRNVEGGMNFSESLRAYPEVFSDVYVDLVKAGEVGGTLETVLQRLSVQLDSEKQLKDSIRSALFYPMVVLTFAVLVMIGMLVFIVPVFMGFYPPGAELPFITTMIVGVSNSMKAYWYLYFMVLFLIVLGIRTYIASDAGKTAFDKMKFKVPVFGGLIQKTVVARFSRTFSTLLAGGIPVLEALDTAGPASGSAQVAAAVKVAGVKIQEGLRSVHR